MIEQRALCASNRCHPADSDRPPRPAMRNSPVCETCEHRAWEAWRRVATGWHATTAALTTTPTGDSAGPVDGGDISQLTLNEAAVDDRHKILTDARYWTQILVDTGRIASKPNPDNVPAMANTIATHIAHLTHLRDTGPTGIQLGVGIVHDALTCGSKMRWLTAPQHTRRYRPGIPCTEHTTSDDGERVPCPGEYTAKLDQQMTGLPDLVCTEDPSHVLTPAGFRRLGRVIDKRLLEGLTA